MKLLIAEHADVHRHLAVEEALLDRVESWGAALYFWRSAHAVVIGKNQNPWRECRVAALRAEGGCLGRRVSGGGAVYHDEGNLNYALFLQRDRYRTEVPYEIVLRALRRLGVAAERLGRTSLGVAGRKFSGSAFCLRRNAAMHHGTLLVAADLERLGRYLTPTREGFSTHAIRSEPAPVTNLSDGTPGVDVASVRSAIEQACIAEFGETMDRVQESELAGEALQTLEARHRSWAWQFGHTPAFDFHGEEGAQVRVEHGLVARVAGAGPRSRWSRGARFDA